MTTTADEKLNEASTHITEAIRALSEVVINECPGHDEYTADYKLRVYESLQTMIGVKRDLGRRI